MTVLIGCESSGIVREEFAKLGHDAWSCDLKPSENGGKHYCKDIFEVLNMGWDLFIAHPPCTYLSVAGACQFKRLGREYEQQKAKEFFISLWNANVKRIAIENPIGIMSSWRQPDQIIQPYWFGDEAQKSTCLWLKNLPPLQPTNLVKKGEMYYSKDGTWVQPKWFVKAKHNDKSITREIRSRTFKGIAKAMATQWGTESLINSLFSF